MKHHDFAHLETPKQLESAIGDLGRAFRLNPTTTGAWFTLRRFGSAWDGQQEIMYGVLGNPAVSAKAFLTP